ncbi:hypothetical protein CIB95_02355 [Lottiidibacillus patelloidae]|uniref:Thioredoxin domain-containing protein n=1 Tax=Lottiidibacillus patelloidae TaxID=2670334 RepID=A0A263BXN9_9BACI|nr:hypothetical protein [Lottiidibacillus patelloidae]OZM58430.1 hypothetical protein CIB95_02355 [Lottiidibacillus patelloidae]
MKWVSVFVFGLLCLLQGCQSAYQPINNNDDSISIDEIKTYIFTDEHFTSMEDNYYDALLQFKNKYPSQKYVVTIADSNDHKELVERYDISKFPTLIMMSNDIELMRIEGNQTKDNILLKLKNTFEE